MCEATAGRIEVDPPRCFVVPERSQASIWMPAEL